MRLHAAGEQIVDVPPNLSRPGTRECAHGSSPIVAGAAGSSYQPQDARRLRSRRARAPSRGDLGHPFDGISRQPDAPHLKRRMRARGVGTDGVRSAARWLSGGWQPAAGRTACRVSRGASRPAQSQRDAPFGVRLPGCLRLQTPAAAPRGVLGPHPRGAPLRARTRKHQKITAHSLGHHPCGLVGEARLASNRRAGFTFEGRSDSGCAPAHVRRCGAAGRSPPGVEGRRDELRNPVYSPPSSPVHTPRDRTNAFADAGDVHGEARRRPMGSAPRSHASHVAMTVSRGSGLARPLPSRARAPPSRGRMGNPGRGTRGSNWEGT